MSGLLAKMSIFVKLKRQLKNYKVYISSRTMENPRPNNVAKAITPIKDKEIDLILAIGGGSVIDTAKAISILLTNQASLPSLLFSDKRITTKPVPLIAVPTTSGTGSEATRYAAFYYYKKGELGKKSLNHNYLLPAYVILDPDLLLTLDKHRTAVSGLDALAQAIESWWSVKSTKQSRNYSRQSLNLILKYLPKSLADLTNVKLREQMLKASNLSGRAINISQTTICHSVSYPLTNYFKVPHGLGAALTLPGFLEFNANIKKDDCLDPRGVSFVKNIIKEIYRELGTTKPREAPKKLRKFIRSTGLGVTLSANGVDNLPLIIKFGFSPERAKNNPRKVSEADLRKILTKIK